MQALATEGLTKDYTIGFWRNRTYRALDRLTLDIAPGEVFGFLGPNGAGKTTTLKLLMQLVYPTAGRAEILGRQLGVKSTPTFFINGVKIEGALPPQYFDQAIAYELQRAKN